MDNTTTRSEGFEVAVSWVSAEASCLAQYLGRMLCFPASPSEMQIGRNTSVVFNMP